MYVSQRESCSSSKEVTGRQTTESFGNHCTAFHTIHRVLILPVDRKTLKDGREALWRKRGGGHNVARTLT